MLRGYSRVRVDRTAVQQLSCNNTSVPDSLLKVTVLAMTNIGVATEQKPAQPLKRDV